MVSECKKQAVVKSTFDKFEMTELPEPLPVRIKFRKVGNLQYISHLDLQRVMGRILVRSGVPVWFTQGFNPHPKIVFAVPLSIGAQSECEYVDIKIDRRISHREIAERLNAQVTDEMKILSVYKPDSKFTEIAYVKYVITLHCDGIDAETAKVDLSQYSDWELCASLSANGKNVKLNGTELTLPAYGVAVLIPKAV